MFALSQALIGTISPLRALRLNLHPKPSPHLVLPLITQHLSIHFTSCKYLHQPCGTQLGERMRSLESGSPQHRLNQDEDWDCPEILLSSFIPSDAAPLGRHQDPSLHTGPCSPHLVTLQCCPQLVIHFEPAFELLFI